MENKVLVSLIVPELEKRFSVYVPLNKTIGNLIVLFGKSIGEIENSKINLSNAMLYSKETSLPYDVTMLVRKSNIRNGTELILI